MHRFVPGRHHLALKFVPGRYLLVLTFVSCRQLNFFEIFIMFSVVTLNAPFLFFPEVIGSLSEVHGLIAIKHLTAYELEYFIKVNIRSSCSLTLLGLGGWVRGDYSLDHENAIQN